MRTNNVLLAKEELPRLDRNTKNLVFTGAFCLYRVNSKDGAYILSTSFNSFFLLDESGHAIDKTDVLDKSIIETQVYFKDTYAEFKVLEIKI